MHFTFIIPLTAAIILFGFSALIFKYFLKTRLFTLLLILVLPLVFGIWMINRTILAISPTYIDVHRLSNVLYIIGPMFLVIFIDIIDDGKISWTSLVFTFYGGCLLIGALFIDQYTVGYNEISGWIQVEYSYPIFYVFLYLYNFIVFFIITGRYLFIIYNENKGTDKIILRNFFIVYIVSIFGTFLFNSLRMMRLLDYQYLNSLDALFIVIGFGYISWQYVKHPHVFHLDLLELHMLGLFVYDSNTGIMLYNYEFQQFERRDLITTAFSGMSSLLGEILESDQRLREVRHGDNIVLFDSSKRITVGLVINLSTIITRNWLFQFRNQFEKCYAKELDEYFVSSEVAFGERPNALVKKIFRYD
jgi:hypothetical protein